MSAAGGIVDQANKREDTLSEGGGMQQALELQQHRPEAQQPARPAPAGATAAGSTAAPLKPAGAVPATTAMSPREAATGSSPSRSTTLPDALPTCPARATAGPAATEGPAPAACGLKGIFGCNGGCTPACSAALPADQKG